MENNEIIGIFIKQLNYYQSNFFYNQFFIEGYLIDKVTGVCVKANSSKTNLISYNSPFTLGSKLEARKKTSTWQNLLIINRNISELNSNNKILIFEVCKNSELQNDEKKKKGVDKIRIALAFLTPLAHDGSMNTNQDLKLQLYKIKKDCKISHQNCDIYHLYSEHKLKKLLGCLEIFVKEVAFVKVMQPSYEESQKKTEKKEIKNINFLKSHKSVIKRWKWSRLPTQSCKVPNKIYKMLGPSKNGFSCLKFSRNGTQIAAAVLSKIIVQEVLSKLEATTLNSHVGFIYELDWSFDDKLLLSVSNDCRGVVWDVSLSAPIFILPHPSYVYCGRWFGNDQQIVTGGKDNLIRYWRKSDDGFHLIEEMGSHMGFISSLATHSTSLVISGDSVGGIVVRKFENGCWTMIKNLLFSEISQKVVDYILIQSSCRRMIVSVRSKSSYLIDFVSGVILQTYKPCVNTFARSVPCLTPCESYFFSFCQNGEVGVWEVNTGKILAAYKNLITSDRLTELSGCIHYHPHEHMVGIGALINNYPLLIIKYEGSNNNDAKKLGLIHLKKSDNFDVMSRSIETK